MSFPFSWGDNFCTREPQPGLTKLQPTQPVGAPDPSIKSYTIPLEKKDVHYQKHMETRSKLLGLVFRCPCCHNSHSTASTKTFHQAVPEAFFLSWPPSEWKHPHDRSVLKLVTQRHKWSSTKSPRSLSASPLKKPHIMFPARARTAMILCYPLLPYPPTFKNTAHKIQEWEQRVWRAQTVWRKKEQGCHQHHMQAHAQANPNFSKHFQAMKIQMLMQPQKEGTSICH